MPLAPSPQTSSRSHHARSPAGRSDRHARSPLQSPSQKRHHQQPQWKKRDKPARWHHHKYDDYSPDGYYFEVEGRSRWRQHAASSTADAETRGHENDSFAPPPPSPRQPVCGGRPSAFQAGRLSGGWGSEELPPTADSDGHGRAPKRHGWDQQEEYQHEAIDAPLQHPAQNLPQTNGSGDLEQRWTVEYPGQWPPSQPAEQQDRTSVQYGAPLAARQTTDTHQAWLAAAHRSESRRAEDVMTKTASKNLHISGAMHTTSDAMDSAAVDGPPMPPPPYDCHRQLELPADSGKQSSPAAKRAPHSLPVEATDDQQTMKETAAVSGAASSLSTLPDAQQTMEKATSAPDFASSLPIVPPDLEQAMKKAAAERARRRHLCRQQSISAHPDQIAPPDVRQAREEGAPSNLGSDRHPPHECEQNPSTPEASGTQSSSAVSDAALPIVPPDVHQALKVGAAERAWRRAQHRSQASSVHAQATPPDAEQARQEGAPSNLGSDRHPPHECEQNPSTPEASGTQSSSAVSDAALPIVPPDVHQALKVGAAERAWRHAQHRSQASSVHAQATPPDAEQARQEVAAGQASGTQQQRVLESTSPVPIPIVPPDLRQAMMEAAAERAARRQRQRALERLPPKHSSCHVDADARSSFGHARTNCMSGECAALRRNTIASTANGEDRQTASITSQDSWRKWRQQQQQRQQLQQQLHQQQGPLQKQQEELQKQEKQHNNQQPLQEDPQQTQQQHRPPQEPQQERQVKHHHNQQLLQQKPQQTQWQHRPRQELQHERQPEQRQQQENQHHNHQLLQEVLQQKQQQGPLQKRQRPGPQQEQQVEQQQQVVFERQQRLRQQQQQMQPELQRQQQEQEQTFQSHGSMELALLPFEPPQFAQHGTLPQTQRNDIRDQRLGNESEAIACIPQWERQVMDMMEGELCDTFQKALSDARFTGGVACTPEALDIVSQTIEMHPVWSMLPAAAASAVTTAIRRSKDASSVEALRCGPSLSAVDAPIGIWSAVAFAVADSLAKMCVHDNREDWASIASAVLKTVLVMGGSDRNQATSRPQSQPGRAAREPIVVCIDSDEEGEVHSPIAHAGPSICSMSSFHGSLDDERRLNCATGKRSSSEVDCSQHAAKLLKMTGRAAEPAGAFGVMPRCEAMPSWSDVARAPMAICNSEAGDGNDGCASDGCVSDEGRSAETNTTLVVEDGYSVYFDTLPAPCACENDNDDDDVQLLPSSLPAACTVAQDGNQLDAQQQPPDYDPSDVQGEIQQQDQPTSAYSEIADRCNDSKVQDFDGGEDLAGRLISNAPHDEPMFLEELLDYCQKGTSEKELLQAMRQRSDVFGANQAGTVYCIGRGPRCGGFLPIRIASSSRQG